MEAKFEYWTQEHNGNEYHMLTALEYPWLNLQVIPFDEEKHDEVIEKLKNSNLGWIIEHPERRDFAVIHAGGSGRLHFTQDNLKELLADMRKCMNDGALCWADKSYVYREKNKD